MSQEEVNEELDAKETAQEQGDADKGAAEAKEATEAKPEAEAKAAEAKPAEAKPAEAKEAAKEPAETKPVIRTRNPDRRHVDGVPAIIRRRRPFGRRKVCRFCVDPTLQIDFRDPQLLKYFVTERGKIIPRRISGNCAKHQRQMARSIKRARVLGLMPFTVVTS